MKKVYFISDVHLGAGTINNHLDHERRVVRFLDSIKHDASALYLLGDIIDFWFEYKTVVPRGFTRFLGKIAELTDMGVEVHWFTGNHDIWLFDYLPKEVGAIVHHKSITKEIMGKKFFLAHGDGLGDDSLGYKFMHRFFRNKLCQKLFSGIHPRWSVALAHYWSNKSRQSNECIPQFMGEDKEHLLIFSRELLKKEDYDYLVFGHRHIMLDMMLTKQSRVVILGDWINHFSYGVFDGEDFFLEQFESDLNPNFTEEDRDSISIAF